MQHGVVSLRQTSDETVRVRKSCRCIDLLVRSIKLAVADILHDCIRKEVSILQNDTERSAEVRLFDLIYVDRIIADLTVLNIIEAIDQVGDSRLAGTGGSDKCNFLSRLRIKLDIVEDHLIVVITEIHAVHDDVSLLKLIGRGAFRFVEMLPRPSSRMLLRLGDVSVLIDDRVHQHDIALIILRLLIEKSEDTIRAGKCHDDRVQLLRNLVDRHGKALIKGKEGSKLADRKTSATVNRKRAAGYRTDDVAEIAQLSIDRRENICETVSFICTVKELIVQSIEFLNGFILVVEDFDDFLAGHHLLDIAVDFTDIPLLFHEISARLSGNFSADKKCKTYHDQGHDRERYAQNDHGYQNRDDRDQTVQELRHTLADHLPQSIDIVRVKRHNVSVAVSVKVADRKTLHMLEHFHTKVAHRSLGYIHHGLLMHERRRDADRIEQCDPEDRRGKRSEVCAS